jgi:hypothetical protein
MPRTNGTPPARRSAPRPIRARVVAFLGGLLAIAALPACFSSELRRVTIDVQAVAAWAGQGAGFGAADSLIGSLVPVTDRIPEVLSGGAQGVEEIALYVQIQNASFGPVEVAVYAHRSPVDLATLLADGVRLTRPILVQPQSAILIDARNYNLYAEGFEEASELLLGGDFFLYVASEASTFMVNGNVPSVSVVVSIED